MVNHRDYTIDISTLERREVRENGLLIVLAHRLGARAAEMDGAREW